MVLVVNETVKHDSFWDFKGKEAFIDEWFLMSSPVPVLLFTSTYLLFVLKVGPTYMKKRSPFNLNNLLLWYNGIQVIASCLLFAYGMLLVRSQGLIHVKCLLDKENTRKIAFGMYMYMFAKISELLDTVFFVLRKKHHQVTFLHLYHHCFMVISTWVIAKYEPTYTAVFLGTVNSFVHIIMYTYYGLSAIPSLAKYLWWKKYITSLQLIQFVAVIVQVAVYNAYSGCPPSYTLLFTILINASLFIYLFGNFYVKAYLKNQRSRRYSEAKSADKDFAPRLQTNEININKYNAVKTDSNGHRNKRNVPRRG